VPVSHIWFLKSMPSRLGLLLDMTARSLERVIYYENYMVVDPGKTPLELKQLLTDTEYRQALDEYGDDSFVAKMGAEAVRDCLVKMDMEATVAELQEQGEEDQHIDEFFERGGAERLRPDLRMRKALDRIVGEVKVVSEAGEKIWTPEKEKTKKAKKLWTPGSKEAS